MWKKHCVNAYENTGCQLTQAVNCADSVTTRMEVFKGCCLTHQIRPISRFFYYPSDVTLVLWQYESRIKGGLLYDNNIYRIYMAYMGKLNKIYIIAVHKVRCSNQRVQHQVRLLSTLVAINCSSPAQPSCN